MGPVGPGPCALWALWTLGLVAAETVQYLHQHSAALDDHGPHCALREGDRLAQVTKWTETPAFCYHRGMARKKPSKVSDQYALVKKFPDGWYYRLGSSSSSPWLGPFQTQHVAERVREHATGGPWGTGVEKPARSHAAKKTASSAPSTFTIVRLRGNQVSFWTGSRWTNEFPDAGEADSLPLAYAAFASAQDRSFTEGDEISIVENYGLDSERTVRHIVKGSQSHATKKAAARSSKAHATKGKNTARTTAARGAHATMQKHHVYRVSKDQRIPRDLRGKSVVYLGTRELPAAGGTMAKVALLQSDGSAGEEYLVREHHLSPL